MSIDAVVFDLDGVLIETEELWDEVREQLARETGARYDAIAQRTMMGMSAPEWSSYMASLGVPGPPAAINDEVVRRLIARYREELFEMLESYLYSQGLQARGGKIIDATIVQFPGNAIPTKRTRKSRCRGQQNCSA